ncbi:signaling mucin HKR1-like isoform X2 [Portunus trituberculatus]|uniref:signaling mucin HKR1-like isoform X2 n=1 Tax=Portunus trituberculatus TaxID=210409 RepID=UPI001E1CB895|nr:signaling mucin HKR1-like isoform X2 [Portunus trituberculatus]
MSEVIEVTSLCRASHQSVMDNDSSEDEVFFGPITNKEKCIAARYHGRKTLILPQRNPLYRRWSTTHIPSAPPAGEVDATPSQCPSMTTDDDATPSQFPSTLTEADVTASQSTNIPIMITEADVTASQSPSTPTEADFTASQSLSTPIEADVIASQSLSTPTEVDVTASQSPSTPTEADVTASQSPSTPTEADFTGSQSLSTPIEADVIASQSLSTPTEVDVTASQSPSILSTLTEADTRVSQSPSTPTEVDVTASQSPSTPTEVDVTASQSPSTSTEVDVTASQSPSTPTEVDVTARQSPSTPTEVDITATQSPSTLTEADVTATQSPSTLTEADVTASQFPNTPTEVDVTASQSPNTLMEADVTASQSPNTPTEVDVTASQSLNTPTKVDVTASQPPNACTEGDGTASQSPDTRTEGDVTASQSPNICREPTITSNGGILTETNYCSSMQECYPTDSDCSILVLEHSSIETDCNLKEPPSQPRDSDFILSESHSRLNNQDGSHKEPVKKELDMNHMELLNSARNSNDNSMKCESSPTILTSRFNDTLEEIELFMKYGMNYGEEGTSSLQGYQKHNISPSHTSRGPECNLEPSYIPKEASSYNVPLNCLKMSSGKFKEFDYNTSELDCKTHEPDSSPSVCPLESVSSHDEPKCYSMEPIASLEKPCDGLEELNTSTSFPVSLKFNDFQECTTPIHSHSSNDFHSSLEFNQASANVVKEKKGRKKLCKTPLQKEGSSLCSSLRARTQQGSSVSSLAKSAAQLKLTKHTQRVTPTCRTPLSQPHSQSSKEGHFTTVKKTPILKVAKSLSKSNTPTTSRMHQPQASQIKLHLDSPTVTLTPLAPGLPPHPQRKGVIGHFPLKRTQTLYPDKYDRRPVWHNSVASPLAKELKNNPPPPFVTNVKSSSCSSGRWQPSPSRSCQPNVQSPHGSSNNFSKGEKSQKIAAEGTLSTHICFNGKDDQVLPVTNYKPGKSVILDKKMNKENIKRSCCKTTPIVEAKVVKHAGRLKVAKCQSAYQIRQSGRTSLMEVSIHQAVSSD